SAGALSIVEDSGAGAAAVSTSNSGLRRRGVQVQHDYVGSAHLGSPPSRRSKVRRFGTFQPSNLSTFEPSNPRPTAAGRGRSGNIRAPALGAGHTRRGPGPPSGGRIRSRSGSGRRAGSPAPGRGR